MNPIMKSADVEIRPVESEHPNGEFEAVISTEDLDRDGDNLYVDEWEQPLPGRIHIDGDHDHSIEKTVGSVVPRIEGNKLIGKGTYAATDYAQMVRQIASDKDAEGHALKMSVTFLQKKNQKSGKPQRELLKAAFVTTPSNTNAVVLSSKGVTPADLAAAAQQKKAELETKDATNWRDNTMAAIASMFDSGTPDQKYLQGVHDIAVRLGAGCPFSDPQATPEVLNGPGNRSVSHAETKSSPTESAEDSDTPAETDSDTGTEADESVEDLALSGKSLALRLGLIDL